MSHIGLASALVFIGVLLSVGLYRRFAISKQWFDIPNKRSSHIYPTPGGAGIAFALILLPLQLQFLPSENLDAALIALISLAFGLACLGWFDDRFGLPALLRGAVFLVAAFSLAMMVAGQGGLSQLAVAVGVFAFINFFNFMDGTDGIAASQCLFISAAMSFFGRDDPAVLLMASTLAAGCLAFLYWNWAPAKAFLGDAGSLFMGFLLAVIALKAHEQGIVHVSTSLLLGIAFIAEPMTVIFLRFLAGENVTEAHRSHVYQLLALRWNSHRRVALCYLVVNCAIVLPLAFYIHAKSIEGTIITAFTYFLFCIIVGILRHRLLLSSADKI